MWVSKVMRWLIDWQRRVYFITLLMISDLNTILENKLMQEWQDMWNSSSKGRFYYKVQSTVSFVVKFSDSNRRKQTCITRLRFGKCLLGDVLFMMRKQNDNNCEACRVKEDVSHFLMDCNTYRDMQVIRNDKLLNADATPCIETLLGDPKWYSDVWRYVLATQRQL